MHFKQYLAIFIILFMVISCCSCGRREADFGEGETAKTNDLKFGFTPGNLHNAFQEEFVSYLREACDAEGIELEICDGQNDVACQKQIIDKWKSEGIDVILCSPIDPIQLQDSFDVCMAAGIPIINLDSECERKTTYIGADQYQYGCMAGELAGDWLNKYCAEQEEIQCAILVKPQSLAMIERENGIIDSLTETCSAAKIVMRKKYTDADSAYRDMEEVLSEYPDIQCVVGMADFAVVAAFNAVVDKKAERDDMCFVGLDATQPMLEKISEDTIIRGTVSQNTEQYAKTALWMAIKALEGEPEDRILVELTPVTRENVDDYLK